MMNKQVIRKTMKNERKRRNFKLVTTEEKETAQCQNQIIIQEGFSQKTCQQQK